MDLLRRIAVAATVLVTIVINILADALPINGLNTAAISNSFKVLFVPAGYVFSIWGLIYIGLVAYAVYQLLPAQRDNPRLQATGWWVSLGGLANCAWIFFWHYENFPLTLVAMLVLLATLIITYLRLRAGGPAKVSSGETWCVRIPFSVYLGWITVATIANVEDLLSHWGFNGLGLPPEFWLAVVLVAVLVISALVSLRERDLAYILVIGWALIGEAVQQSANSFAVVTSLVTAVLVAALILYSLLQRPSKVKITIS